MSNEIIIRDTIERRSVESLIPYARNARVHSPEQIDQLAQSIREFGWTMPLLVDESGVVMAGHGRLLAAQKLGMAEVPVIFAGNLTDAQRRAYILADNQIALNGTWDKSMLGLELADLSTLNFDMALTGFNIGDMNSLMSQAQAAESESNEQDDDVPDVDALVATRPGDVWELGDHRLVCGDATSKEAVAKVMRGESAVLCFTSPPYADQRNYASGGISDWDALMRGVIAAAPFSNQTQILVNLGLVHRNNEFVSYWDAWLKWMSVCAWRRFAWYVWDQGPGMPGDWNGRLAPAFEFVFHFNREPRRPNKIVPCIHAGDNKRSTSSGGGMRNKKGKIGKWTHQGVPTQDHKMPDSILRIMRAKGKPGKDLDHPAIFPVELPQHVMLTYSNPGDICYEPFCGSGTSIIAAEKIGRRMRAVELAPQYCDVAIVRWQRFTGRAAVLASDGRTFDQVRAAEAQKEKETA